MSGNISVLKGLDIPSFAKPFHEYEEAVVKLEVEALHAQHRFMSALLDFMCKHVFLKAFDLDEASYVCKHEYICNKDDIISLQLSVVHPDKFESVFYVDVLNTGFFIGKNKLDKSLPDTILRAELVAMLNCMHTLFSGIYEVNLKLAAEIIQHEHEEAAGFTYEVEEERTKVLNATLPCFQTVEELLASFMISGLDFASFLESYAL